MLVKTIIMYVIVVVLLYLAIKKKFEPLLLLPIAFGMLLANLPGANLMHLDWFLEKHIEWGDILNNGGLIDFLYMGVKLGIYPSLIFMGVGAMTDFTALISNPKSLLMGAGAQLWRFRCVLRSASARVQPERGGVHRYHRRRGRSYGYPCHENSRSGAPRRYRYRGLLVHGADSDNPASVHAYAHLQEGARDNNDRAETGFPDREARVPGSRHNRRFDNPSGRGSAYRLPYVRKSAQCLRRHRETFEDRSERAYEYRHYLPRRLCRSYRER